MSSAREGRPGARDGASPLAVRGATAADHDAIVRLLDELELDYAGRDLTCFVVGELEGRCGPEIVGIAELRRVGGVALLSCVGIRADLQGRGLGRALVAGALNGVGCDVHLFTLVPGFFAALGFAECAPTLARESLYGCDACEPGRCRGMVLRADAT